MPKQVSTGEKRWFALSTYSGHEDSVAYNLRQRIESMGMEGRIFNVIVPKEKKIKVKSGKRYTVEEKIFPGYVLVEMVVTDDSWYVVRNTPNVTGFVGSGTIPTLVSEEVMKSIRSRMGAEEPKFKIEFSPGDLVRMMDGPFKDYEGKVSEIDESKGKVRVLVNIFVRETPEELDFLQVKKV